MEEEETQRGREKPRPVFSVGNRGGGGGVMGKTKNRSLAMKPQGRPIKKSRRPKPSKKRPARKKALLSNGNITQEGCTGVKQGKEEEQDKESRTEKDLGKKNKKEPDSIRKRGLQKNIGGGRTSKGGI